MSKRRDQPFRNRIVRYSEEAPDQLLANPRNWRTHPGSQAEALRGVLGDVGYVQSVIVNERTGFLVDGHLRVQEALKAGQAAIPVVWVDLSEAEEALVLATLDPMAALAGTDAAKLDDLLRDVSTDSAAVQAMLDTLATAAGIVPGVEAGQGGDEFDATPDDGPTRTALGDLWLIGGVHRLLVGDCTDSANVARLMGGARADGIFTSPPYDQQRTYNGNMAADWLGLMCGAFGAVLPHLDDDAQVFVNLGLVHREGRVVRYWDGFIGWMESSPQDVPLFGWYVWDKTHALPGDFGGRFAPAHEWVFHFNKHSIGVNKTIPKKPENIKLGGGTGTRNKDGKMKGYRSTPEASLSTHKIPDSVIRVVQEMGGIDGHPAPFPVALPLTFLQAYAADVWYEPFLGSGTTLIAAHRTGRRCYGLELEPRYADVILRRAEAEGLSVERVKP